MLWQSGPFSPFSRRASCPSDRNIAIIPTTRRYATPKNAAGNAPTAQAMDLALQLPLPGPILDSMRGGSSARLAHGHSDKWDTSGVLLEESLVSAPIDLAAVFGNRRPVEVEIGTGKGGFLLARAAARPELNFLGIDWAAAYCRYAADRFRRAGLTNVRMLRADAAYFFRTCLADGSIWRLHVYFPDPWPKRKHRRRRLIQPSFLAEVRRVLQSGGEFLVVTDHRDYFEQILRVTSGTCGFARIPFPRLIEGDDALTGTNFERKYSLEGRRFYRIAKLCYV